MINFAHFKLAALPALIVMVTSGCTLQPDYKRPEAPVTKQWNDKSTHGAVASEMAWSEFFSDPTLRQLITLALKNNSDLKVAALNVESARAQYGVTRADLFPSVGASLTKTAEHLPGGLYSTQTTGPVTYQQYEGNLAVSSWELDFFGRIRSLRDEALETYFSYEATRQATQLSLIAEVAEAYITLCADADLKKVAKDTAESQQESLKLVQQKFAAGIVTEQDVLQAATSVKSAEADVSQYERQRRQAANALQLLLGTSLPAGVVKNATLEKRWVFPELESGLPSDVLTRRPDVIAAEHTLKAANANIGAARAAFFPSISLTASGGSASSSLSRLFDGGTGAWSFGPSISIPIFEGGKNRANLDVAEVSKRTEIVNYEKAIQQAFKEVSDALSGAATYDAEVQSRKENFEVNNRNYQLAALRYNNGADDYLEVLTAQRSLYSARQNYLSTLADSLDQKITLYKVLGGGWK